ncbi:hypothetical protein [Nocardioides sp. YIM 152588]|uniref:pentapeptide repeat-containing protein n=1 Tax=Nocardioides sp. YIM 152588 TaxID=3158259 RepID=UPI0032E4F7A0
MKVAAPRITRPSLVDLEEAGADVALDHGGTDGHRVVGAVLDGVQRWDTTFRETELVRARATGAELTGCRFLDVRFDGLDAPALTASDSAWRDTEIVGSRLGTLGLYDAKVSSLRIADSKVAHLGLHGAEVDDLLVEHCTIEELDLTDARLTRVAFRDTSVRELTVAGARLKDVDLREARLTSVAPVAGLRGAVLTVPQLLDLAPELAAEVGIRLG